MNKEEKDTQKRKYLKKKKIHHKARHQGRNVDVLAYSRV